MIHLYSGDGKGKTTAAMGLALRAAGQGQGVLIAQFLKGSRSGERVALRQLPLIRLLPVPEQVKFTFQMDETDRREAAGRFSALLDACEEAAEGGEVRMLILDEVCGAVNAGLLPLERVIALLDRWGHALEIVLTGRNPAPGLAERADYHTEMCAHRHPYQRGVPARPGVEY